ncbi:hypothetical protein HPB47_022966, partial [Ixodes persulcatus]
MPRVDEATRVRILTLVQEGRTRRSIAAEIGCALGTVTRIPKFEKNLVSTIRKRLHAAGLRSRVACQRPLLTQSHKRLRLEFATNHLAWTQCSVSPRRVRELLEELCIQELPWPPKGADFNVIENIWSLMKRRLARRQLHGASPDLLWEVVQEEWSRLQALPDLAGNLYKSLSGRLQDVVRRAKREHMCAVTLCCFESALWERLRRVDVPRASKTPRVALSPARPSLPCVNLFYSRLYAPHVENIHSEFQQRFKGLEVEKTNYDPFRDPFSASPENSDPTMQRDLIGLRCPPALKSMHRESQLLEFFENLDKNKYENL